MYASWGQLAWTQVWQLTVLAVVVSVAAAWLGRRRPHLAHLLWLLVVVKSLTPPLWSSPGGVFCWLTPSPVESSEMVSTAERAVALNREVVAKSRLADDGPGEASRSPSRSPSGGSSNGDTAAASGAAGLAELDASPRSTSTTAQPTPRDATLRTSEASERPDERSGWDSGMLGGLRTWFERWWAVGWGVGALVYAVAAWLKMRGYRRQWSDVDGPASAAVQAVVDRLAVRLELRRAVRAIVTHSNLGPAVVGVVRPLIVVPRALLVCGKSVGGEDLEEEQRETYDEAWLVARAEALAPILAHELLHVRRGDLWIGWLLVASRIVWWFHPLVAWASRWTAREAERCCDEEVIGALGCAPSEYARSLVEVLECKRWLRMVAPFPGVRPVEITTRRLERIMSLGQGCRKRTPWWMWGLFVVAAALTLPGAARLAAGPRKQESRKAAANPGAANAPSAVPAASAREVRKYHVADLLRRFADEFQTERDDAAAGLIDLVRSVLLTPSTAQNPSVAQTGGIARAEWAGQSLRVVASSAAHERLAERLAHWREVGWPQVVTETRLLSGPSDVIDGWNLTWRLTPPAAARPAQHDSPEHDRLDGLLRTGGDVDGDGRWAGGSETITRAVPLRAALLSTAAVDKLIAKAQDDRRMNLIASPKITTFSGQMATVMSEQWRALQGARADAQGAVVAEPNFVPEGWRLNVVAKVRRDARIEVAATAMTSLIRRVDRFAFHQGLKAEDGPKDGAVPQTFTVEVPELAARRIHFNTALGADEWLVVRGLADGANQEQGHESLLMIRCRRVDAVLAANPPASKIPPTVTRTESSDQGKPPGDAVQLGRGVNSDAGVVGAIVLNAERPAADEQALVLRRYAVADLVIPSPKSVRVDLVLGDGNANKPDAAPPADAVKAAGGSWKELIDLIVKTTSPDSWQAAGGRGEIAGESETFSLIVKQTGRVHREIAELLEQLRRLSDVNASIRVRLVSASPTCLAELGLLPKPGADRSTNGDRPGASVLLTKEILERLESESTRARNRTLHVWEWPRVTVFNAQRVEYHVSAGDEEARDGAPSAGDELTMEILPVISADRSQVRLSVALAALTDHGGLVGIHVGEVPDGRWFVLPTRRLGAKQGKRDDAREIVMLIQPLVVTPVEDKPADLLGTK